VQDNEVPGDFGNLAGGLAIRNSSVVTLTRSSVFANKDPGGVPPCPCVVGEDGIRVVDSSLTVIDSLIDDDGKAEDFDFSLHFDGDDLRISNSTITGTGSWPLEITSARQVTVTFSTVVSQAADKGAFGNLARPMSLYHVSNSIIGECWQRMSGPSLGYNVEPTTSCSFTATGDQQGVDFAGLLAPLADNGGPTQTFALREGAVAIDAIPAGVNGCQTGNSFDQRGAPRAGGNGQGGNACDIGAFEANSSVSTSSQSKLYLPIVFRQMP